MKAKIDLEKFISSMLGYAEDNCEETMLDYLHSALQDQDLEYKDGKIVEIEQEQPYNNPLFFEKGKWYTCIAKVDGFKVGHTYQSKMDGTVSNDSGAMYMYHNDVNLIFRPATEIEVEKKENCTSGWFWKNNEGMTILIPKDLKGTDTDGGVVGEKGEQGKTPFNKERLMEVAKPETFEEKIEYWQRMHDIAMEKIKGTFKEEDSLETKAIKEQIENLKKRIEDNQLGCIVQRLDKIIELLQSAILILPKEPYVPPITYTTANTFGSDYDIDTDKIKQDETSKSES